MKATIDYSQVSEISETYGTRLVIPLDHFSPQRYLKSSLLRFLLQEHPVLSDSNGWSIGQRTSDHKQNGIKRKRRHLQMKASTSDRRTKNKKKEKKRKEKQRGWDKKPGRPESDRKRGIFARSMLTFNSVRWLPASTQINRTPPGDIQILSFGPVSLPF